MYIETTTEDHLQSSDPKVRANALRILYNNAVLLYGDTHPAHVEKEKQRWEKAEAAASCFPEGAEI